MDEGRAGLPDVSPSQNDTLTASLGCTRGEASWASQCESEDAAAGGEDNGELERRERVAENRRATFGAKPPWTYTV